MPKTDHSADIAHLRDRSSELAAPWAESANRLDLAADLLEMHDATGISLDAWPTARRFVEVTLGHPITENGA